MIHPIASMLLVLASLAAPEDAYRTWTDATGRFRIEAELLAVRGGKVFLKKRSGDAIIVPLKKLSQVDRRFLADRSKGTQSPPSKATAADAGVVLTQQVRVGDQRWRTLYHPGVYFARLGSDGYVLSLLPPRVPTNKKREDAKVTFEVIFGAGTPRTLRVAAKPVGILTAHRRAVWKVSSPDLPPVPPIAKEAPPTGQKVTLHRLDVVTDNTSQCLVARTEGSAPMGDVARDEHGTLLQYSVQCGSAEAPHQTLVADAKGRVIGLVVKTPDASRPRKPPSAEVLPLHQLSAPRLESIRLAGKSWGRDGIEYRVEARIHDPFGRVKAGRVQLKRKGAQGDGTDCRLSIPDIPMFQWQSHQRIDPSLARGEWADSESPDGSTTPKYVASFEYVCRDGTSGRAAPRDVKTAMIDYKAFRHMAHTTVPSPKGGMIITHDVTAEDGALPKPKGLNIPKSKSHANETAARLPSPPGYEAWDLSSFFSSRMSSFAAAPTKKPTNSFCWSPKGDAFYFVGSGSMMHRVTLADLRRTHSIQFGVLSHMPRVVVASCSEGIAVLTDGKDRGSQILWMLDPSTLDVLRATRIPRVNMVAASPKTPYLYLQINGISVFDARSGRIVSRTKEPAVITSYSDSASESPGRGGLHVSEDGKWMIWRWPSHEHTLQRARLDGRQIIWESVFIAEYSSIDTALPYAAKSMAELLEGITPDGAWFGKNITQCRDDIVTKKGHPSELPNKGRFLATDPASGLLLAGCVSERPYQSDVRVYSSKLETLAQIPVEGKPPFFARFHPQGNQAAVSAARNLFYLKIIKPSKTDPK